MIVNKALHLGFAMSSVAVLIICLFSSKIVYISPLVPMAYLGACIWLHQQWRSFSVLRFNIAFTKALWQLSFLPSSILSTRSSYNHSIQRFLFHYSPFPFITLHILSPPLTYLSMTLLTFLTSICISKGLKLTSTHERKHEVFVLLDVA